MRIGNISLSLYKIPMFLESNLHKYEMWDNQDRRDRCQYKGPEIWYIRFVVR